MQTATIEGRVEGRVAAEESHDWSGLEPWRRVLEVQLAGHCRDANEVDDIVQETFLRAARSRRSVRTPERFRSWLLRIAFNALRDLRRRARTIGHVPLEEALEVSDSVECTEDELSLGPWKLPESEAMEFLRSAWTEIRPDDRNLLDAFYRVPGTDAAAEAAGVPQRLVKVRVFRARGRLRSLIRRRLERRLLHLGGRS